MQVVGCRANLQAFMCEHAASGWLHRARHPKTSPLRPQQQRRLLSAVPHVLSFGQHVEQVALLLVVHTQVPGVRREGWWAGGLCVVLGLESQAAAAAAARSLLPLQRPSDPGTSLTPTQSTAPGGPRRIQAALTPRPCRHPRSGPPLPPQAADQPSRSPAKQIAWCGTLARQLGCGFCQRLLSAAGEQAQFVLAMDRRG